MVASVSAMARSPPSKVSGDKVSNAVGAGSGDNISNGLSDVLYDDVKCNSDGSTISKVMVRALLLLVDVGGLGARSIVAISERVKLNAAKVKAGSS